MLKAKKIRLNVSEQDTVALEFMQGKGRGLYNWLVTRLRDGERWHFKQEKARLAESREYDPDLNGVYGKLLAEVYFRLDAAMQGFFRRLQAGETPGFPRVRPRHQFFTLCYPAAYLLFEGKRLILPTGGKGRNKRFPNILATLTEVPPLWLPRGGHFQGCAWALLCLLCICSPGSGRAHRGGRRFRFGAQNVGGWGQ